MRHATMLEDHPRAMICLCNPNTQYPAYFQIHLPGCDFMGGVNCQTAELEKTKGPKIIIPGAMKWTPPKNAAAKISHKRREPKAKPYRLVLQFYFSRPVAYALWKKIKAPAGWRKGPVPQKARDEWCGVRFLCSDLKYALTPDEVEQMRSTLLMCLKEDYW